MWSRFDYRIQGLGRDVVLRNPGSGQYTWHSQTKSPELTGFDRYCRVLWKDLEPSCGQYDFSAIEREIDLSGSEGGLLGFRVMAVCDGSLELLDALPAYLRNDARTWSATGHAGLLSIPDWNDEGFLSSWERLFRELGRVYSQDRRLGWIEVGGYGNWGEWHSYPFEGEYPGPLGQRDITLESSKRIIDAVAEAFPSKYVVLNTVGSRIADEHGFFINPSRRTFFWSNAVWQYALGLTEKMGIRNDCLGALYEQGHARAGLYEASRFARDNGGIDPLERWMSAPFISEWCPSTHPSDGVGLVPQEQFLSELAGPQIAYEDEGKGEERHCFQRGLVQVEAWHISLLSSSNFSGELAEYASGDRIKFREANLRAGYRYCISRVQGELNAGGTSTLTTTWENVNVAPTYHDWDVVYELKRPGSDNVAASFTSSVELSEVLPGTVQVTDTFDTRGLKPGNYELSIRVVDPEGYFAPMGLAIQGEQEDGSYLLLPKVQARR